MAERNLHDSHYTGGRYPAGQRRQGASHPMVRWEALATGSLVGIGSWALAYVLGATVVLACGVDPGAAPIAARLLMGVWGGVSASMALAFAAYTAARTGGARSGENALFYGLSLWSMSTITLVTLTVLAAQGLFTQEMVRATPIFAVGLAAVGSLPQGQEWASAGTFAAILATLLVSLAFALWGSARAYVGHAHVDR